MKKEELENRLRSAAATYNAGIAAPADLERRVSRRLALTSYSGQRDNSVNGRPPGWELKRGDSSSVGSWPMQLLATAALLLLLIGAGVMIHQARLLNGRAPATTPPPKTSAYSAMVAGDLAKLIAARSSFCASVQDRGCPRVLAGLAEAALRGRNDMGNVQSPSRFSMIAAELRQHFAVMVSDFNSAELAFNAGDQKGMLASENAGLNELGVTESLAEDIAQAHSVSTTGYRQQIALLLEDVQACPATCQAVLVQPNASCPAGSECVSFETSMQESIEEIQGLLASVFPPDSLSAQDARVQHDLANAHAALSVMLTQSGNPRNASGEYTAAHRNLVSAIVAFSTDTKQILGR